MASFSGQNNNERKRGLERLPTICIEFGCETFYDRIVICWVLLSEKDKQLSQMAAQAGRLILLSFS